MAVRDNLTARLTPQGRGKAEVALIGFNAHKHLTDYRNALHLILVKRGSEERLNDWPQNNLDELGFLIFKPINPQQRGMDFIFTIDASIVNALAYDGSNNFILKLRQSDGVIRAFSVDVQRKDGRGLEADLGYREAPQVAPDASFAQPNEPAPSMAQTQGFAPQGPNGQAASTAAPAAATGSGIAGKIIGLIVAVILLLAAAFFLWKFFLSAPEGVAPAPQGQGSQEQAAESAAAPEPVAEPEPAAASEPEQVAVPEPTLLVSANSACRLEGASGDDKELLNQCLATQPTREDLTGLLAESLRLERCEIAQRILRTIGRAPDGTAFAYVYATLANPSDSRHNKCIVKSAEDAKYWGDRVAADRSFTAAAGDALLEQLIGKQ